MLYLTRSNQTLFLSHSQFDKVYQNLYANGYSEADNEVQLKGYLDPTGRDSLTASYSLIKDFGNHTLLLGAEYVDQENTNYRNKSNFRNTTFGSNKKLLGFILRDQVPLRLVQNVNPVIQVASDRWLTKRERTARPLNLTLVLKTKTTTDIEVNSIYFQDQWDITDNLILTLGGRYDEFDITVNDIKNSNITTANIEEFGPRGGVVFKPNENSSFYASYSETFLPKSGEQFKKMEDVAAISDPDEFENTEDRFQV